MTITQAHAPRGAFTARWTSWWATAAVVALNLAVVFASTHALADPVWLALITLLLAAVLAARAPKRYLPAVQALMRAGLLTLPAFFAFLFFLTDWTA